MRKMAVTRALAEHRALGRIENRLRRSDPQLAAMLAVFNYIHRHERGSAAERLPRWRLSLRQVPAIALALAGLALIVVGMIFLTQVSHRLIGVSAAVPLGLAGLTSRAGSSPPATAAWW